MPEQVLRPIEMAWSPLAGARHFRFGECAILLSRDAGRMHLSISHPNRHPTWEEIRDARYALMHPNMMVAMLLPPPAEYVNVQEHCFHLWEIRDNGMPRERGLVLS